MTFACLWASHNNSHQTCSPDHHHDHGAVDDDDGNGDGGPLLRRAQAARVEEQAKKKMPNSHFVQWEGVSVCGLDSWEGRVVQNHRENKGQHSCYCRRRTGLVIS